MRHHQFLHRFLELKTIIILAVTGIFDYYFMGLIAFALPQLQQKFHIPEEQVGFMLGLFRLGFIPAVLITVLADLVGRKPFILFATFICIVLSVATANTNSLGGFITWQFMTFMFISAETSVAVVMIVEETKNTLRGLAVSLLSGLSAIGTACAALVYGLNEYLGVPFQYSYYYGLAPLLIILYLRTRLKETARFDQIAHTANRNTLKLRLQGWKGMLIAGRGRLLIICLIVFFFDAAVVPSYILASKFLQQAHSFTPYQVSTLIIGSGFFATVGSLVICYYSDLVGRKKVLAVLMLITVLAIVGFYHADRYYLYICWFLFIIASASAAALLMTIGTELFPTATRASAAGLRGMFSAVGGALGLMVESRVYRYTGEHRSAVSLITIFILISLIIAYFRVPETAGKELEQITGTYPLNAQE